MRDVKAIKGYDSGTELPRRMPDLVCCSLREMSAGWWLERYAASLPMLRPESSLEVQDRKWVRGDDPIHAEGGGRGPALVLLAESMCLSGASLEGQNNPLMPAGVSLRGLLFESLMVTLPKLLCQLQEPEICGLNLPPLQKMCKAKELLTHQRRTWGNS